MTINNLSKIKSLINRHRRILLVLFTVYVTFIILPIDFNSVSPGLDNSWAFGINWLVNSNYIFGKDINYSYGPLGYILVPLDIGNNLIYSIIINLSLNMIIIFIIIYLITRYHIALNIFMFLLLYLFTNSIYFNHEYYLLFVSIFLLSIGIKYDELRIVSFLLGAILTMLYILIKIALGPISLVLLTSTLAIAYLMKMKNLMINFISVISVLILLLIIIVVAIFKSLDTFFLWMETSFDIINNYNIAMSIEGSSIILIFSFICVAIYLCIMLILYKKKSSLLMISILGLIALFFVFKHAFGRQDAHAIRFFTFYMMIMSLMMLHSNNGKEIKILLSSSLLPLIFTIIVVYHYNNSVISDALLNLTGQKSVVKIEKLINLNETRKELAIQSEKNLASDKLPFALIQELQQDNKTVDVIPWEICYLPANNLKWNPIPTIQTIFLYTHSLDEKGAEHFSQEESPDFILVEFKSIDQRNIFTDTPATWKAIMEHYEFDKYDSTKEIILLRKRKTVSEICLSTLSLENHRFNEWIKLPTSHPNMYISIELNLTWYGMITNLLFRIPSIYLDLEYESGNIVSYRIIQDNLKAPLFISYIPTNIVELKDLFLNIVHDRVISFRLSGNGTIYYNNDLEISFKYNDLFYKLK